MSDETRELSDEEQLSMEQMLTIVTLGKLGVPVQVGNIMIDHAISLLEHIVGPDQAQQINLDHMRRTNAGLAAQLEYHQSEALRRQLEGDADQGLKIVGGK